MPTQPILDHLWIIPLLPLLGSAINGLLGGKWPNKIVNSIALGATGLSFASALEAVREYFASGQQLVHNHYFDWISAGKFTAGFDLQLDQLTVVMLLVVTGVGFLIHIYSTGYMAHEGGYYRFFSYLNLFMFFMLILVLAANYVLLFVGWEGVGLCSYLLIGFYFLKKSASDAGKKAFIVNRIGDFGFMLGMFLLFRTFGTLDFNGVFAAAAGPGWGTTHEPWGQFGTFTIACLLLFMGATGKSAQLPLYVWLPDAMEGPTPVSALIHAATMVTAGVYVVARSHSLFAHSETALVVVAVIGCATAFFAATIGLVQTDIKRVLAYSTVSQLGYMFLACGVGAFSAGIFHLMTHAFFKALLFLAAGSVIHAMGGEQDMRHMGGLSKKIKYTYWTMLIATLAIAGIPPLAGFFSKDAILLSAFQIPGGHPLYAIGLLTALLTSFYMFRLIFLTFHGKQRYDEHHVHVHESPWSMLGPLVILAVLSIIGGWLAAPALWGGPDYFTSFLSPVFASPQAAEAVNEAAAHQLELILAVVAVASALIGLGVAFWLYLRQPGKPEKIAKSLQPVYNTLLNKYYVDELYNAVVIQPLMWISTNVLWKIVDVAGIDGTVNGIATGATSIGDTVRRTQSGNTRSYAVWVVIGALVVIAVIFFWPTARPVLGMVR
jgi:NADH-quinone oxidoreductase subunit L